MTTTPAPAQPGRSYRAHGVVLRTYKLGETDRIVVMMTEGHGKVRGVAKGVRKSKSRLGNRLEPTGHVSVQLYRGKGELQTVTQAQTIDSFLSLRGDLDRLAAASAMLEAVDHMSLEGEANPEMYTMLVGALRKVDQDNPPMTTAGFFWKLLALEGFQPQLNACVGCGTDERLSYFDLNSGGVRCEACRRGRPISNDALRIVRLMLGGRLGAALQLPTTPASGEVNELAASAIEHHIERRLKSLAFLRF